MKKWENKRNKEASMKNVERKMVVGKKSEQIPEERDKTNKKWRDFVQENSGVSREKRKLKENSQQSSKTGKIEREQRDDGGETGTACREAKKEKES